jgi:hypothetical protein
MCRFSWWLSLVDRSDVMMCRFRGDGMLMDTITSSKFAMGFRID